MARFHSGARTHRFGDMVNHRANFGAPFAPHHKTFGNGAGNKVLRGNPGIHSPKGSTAAKPGHNPGGVSVSVPSHHTIPPASKHMDAKENPVPRGFGGMLRRRGMHSNAPPKTLPESVRLGNFGQPPGQTSKGSDMPFGGRENPRERRTLPAHEMAHDQVKKRQRGGKPKTKGNEHINKGTPRVAANPRVVSNLAAKIL
jgi:hypothetical protein